MFANKNISTTKHFKERIKERYNIQADEFVDYIKNLTDLNKIHKMDYCVCNGNLVELPRHVEIYRVNYQDKLVEFIIDLKLEDELLFVTAETFQDINSYPEITEIRKKKFEADIEREYKRWKYRGLFLNFKPGDKNE